MQRHSIVDDNLDTAETMAEAKQLLHEIQDILKEAGMTAHKFGCNEAEEEAGYPLDKVVKLSHFKDPNAVTDLTNTKALGLVWDTASDTFSFWRWKSRHDGQRGAPSWLFMTR